MYPPSEKKINCETEEKITEIGRYTRSTESGQTVYRLYRAGVDSDNFRISAECGDEIGSGVLCGSLSLVSALFEKIVNGEVQPYILSEILEDYTCEHSAKVCK